MNKLTIPTTEEIFKLRNFLQQISHISFTFSKVNQSYPLDTLSENQGQELLRVYKNLLNDADDIIKSFKKIYDQTTT